MFTSKIIRKSEDKLIYNVARIEFEQAQIIKTNTVTV